MLNVGQVRAYRRKKTTLTQTRTQKNKVKFGY